ncbi:hypothetical protein [Streptomyces sp. NPDC001978]|uniref:hypothetical protein n=1 Tax=Streptomyces sp. NPDC001978 TaxID=3364627 RepID=UPI00368A47FA
MSSNPSRGGLRREEVALLAAISTDHRVMPVTSASSATSAIWRACSTAYPSSSESRPSTSSRAETPNRADDDVEDGAAHAGWPGGTPRSSG